MTLEHVHIVDDALDAIADISVENGVISRIDLREGAAAPEMPVLLPAFTDLHAHFRDPGFTYKEDIVSGSRAAVRGGYTAVNLMPNTNPVVSSLEQARDVERRIAQLNLVRANQCISMTIDEKGDDCSHLRRLEAGSVPFVSDDGKGVNRSDVMEEIFKICKEKNFLIMAHEEDARYSPQDLRMAENAMTFRDIELCAKTGGTIHFCHVSTRESIEAIAAAKRKGLRVSCEITPHHIYWNAEQANRYRVAPPFRTDDDIKALVKALQDGTADTISTDHAPHTPEDKAAGANGISGIETAFPLCYTKLVKGGFLNLQQLVKLMATTPSAMMHLNKGRFRTGMAADFVLVDLNEPYRIKAADFASRGKNTPFDGETVYGRILKTYMDGVPVFEA